MNINQTLIIQMVVFLALIWFTMKFVWPIILGAMNEREKKIAAGLAAAEQGQKDLSEAKSRADDVIKEARTRALTIESRRRREPTRSSMKPARPRASRVKKPWPPPSPRSRSRAIARATSFVARW